MATAQFWRRKAATAFRTGLTAANALRRVRHLLDAAEYLAWAQAIEATEPAPANADSNVVQLPRRAA